MYCVHCGAAVIEGSARCYRCQQAIVTPAAPRQAAHPAAPARPAARRPAPAAPSSSGGRLVAAYAMLALAGFGLVDLVAMHDSWFILVFVALWAAAGAALLLRWRGAWAGALTLAIVDGCLGLVASIGGGAGLVLGGVVATLSVVAIVGLSRPGARASMRKAKQGRASDDVVVIS